MTESPPILQLNNVEAAYGAVKAIRGVSLSVTPGSIVTVLGSNGAGKTTILKTISGILDPQKGSIVFRHERLEGHDPAWIVRQGLVHVPEGREIFPLLTVRENLLMGAYTRPAHDKEEVAQDIEDVYAYFPILRERAQQDAGLLSGGQQQMLAISRALMANPDLILLDEPSNNLDTAGVAYLADWLGRAHGDQGIVIVSHDAALMAQSGRVGRANYTGPTAIRDTITVTGAIVSNQRYGFAWANTFGSHVSGYRHRNLYYDNNLLYCPPPYFPTGKNYLIDLWEEL